MCLFCSQLFHSFQDYRQKRTIKKKKKFYTKWNIFKEEPWTYPLFKGEVRRGAPRVFAGQQPMRVPRARRVRVGGGVGAGRTHGRRHVAVVVQHGAVARVGGRRLRGGRVGPTQQRGGPPVHRLVRPEGRRQTSVHNCSPQSQTCVWVWRGGYWPAAPPLSRSQGHPSPAWALLVLVGLMELREGCVWQVLHL